MKLTKQHLGSPLPEKTVQHIKDNVPRKERYKTGTAHNIPPSTLDSIIKKNGRSIPTTPKDYTTDDILNALNDIIRKADEGLNLKIKNK